MFANAKAWSASYGVNLAETSWHDLGIHPHKSKREAAGEGDVTREPRKSQPTKSTLEQ
jgi:hypothetical protein